MSSKFGYWNCRGVGQAMRLMIAYVGEDCEEKRYEFTTPPEYNKNWLPEKFSLGLDFPNLPYYNDGKVNITQSHAILRYLGIKHGLEPKSDDDKIRAALASEQLKDFLQGIETLLGSTAAVSAEEMEKSKTNFLEGNLPPKLKQWEAFLGDKAWLAGQNISYVDFAFYNYLTLHVLLKEDLLKDYPNLSGYISRFEALPKMQDYMNSDKFLRSPIVMPWITLFQ